MVAMLRLRTAAIKQPDKMNRRAPTYFTRRFKSAETVALFNKSVEEHILNLRTHALPANFELECCKGGVSDRCGYGN